MNGPSSEQVGFNLKRSCHCKKISRAEGFKKEAAKGEAEKDITDIKESSFNSLNGDWSKWSIEICDHQRALLLVVPFSSN